MEYIQYTTWQTLADVTWETGNPLPEDRSVVFCSAEHIYSFFKEIKQSNNRYVLISAASDYCFVEQAKNPIWADMNKWLEGFHRVGENLDYHPCIIPPRCDVKFCKIDDAFSVKCYSHTSHTFNEVPHNILQWYSTNNEILDGRIINIPFGIPGWTLSLIAAARKANLHLKERTVDTYVNFQLNTIERMQLRRHFKQIQGAVVEDEVSHADFVNRLLSSQYVASSPGNGFDCFRNLESIYCGAIPLMFPTKEHRWMTPYESLTPSIVLGGQIQEGSVPNSLEGTTADMVYWRDKIEGSSKLVKALA